MQQYFIEGTLSIQERVKMKQEQAHHIKNVLRMKQGEIIRIANFDEDVYFAHVEYEGNDVFACIDKRVNLPNKPIHITLAQALIKGEKWDYLLQKTCEFGVDCIQPISTSRCVVKIKDDKNDKKLQRWNKITQEACEQCKRASIVKVMDVMSYKDIDFASFDMILLGYELADHTTMKLKDTLTQAKNVNRILCIVGPEGGFSEEEVAFFIEKGCTCISLGSRILRAETAAMAMVHALTYTYDC